MKPRIVSALALHSPTSSCEALEMELRGCHHVRAFAALISREFRTHHNVGYYAKQLGLTPNYLNALCQRHCQQTASAILHAQITEAKRQLCHSRVPVAVVAQTLGFADASYFARYFKKHVLLTPLAFRLTNVQY